MYLKDILNYFEDEAEYIESISFDNCDTDFKLSISFETEDELDTADIYLYSDGASSVSELKSVDVEDYEPYTFISGEFFKIIASFVNKWKAKSWK